MQKQTLKKFVLTPLFFVVIGLAFLMMWGREFSFDSKTKEDPDQTVEEEMGPLYSLQPFQVELAGRYLNVIHEKEGKAPKLGTRKRYLLVTIDLELRDKGTIELVKNRVDQIKAAISEVVASKKVKDIETVEGKETLGDEIVHHLNAIFSEEAVTRVHFKDFIIQ